MELTGLVLSTSFFSIVNSHFSSSSSSTTTTRITTTSCFLLDYSITGSLFSVLHCAVSEAKEEKDHEGYVL